MAVRCSRYLTSTITRLKSSLLANIYPSDVPVPLVVSKRRKCPRTMHVFHKYYTAKHATRNVILIHSRLSPLFMTMIEIVGRSAGNHRLMQAPVNNTHDQSKRQKTRACVFLCVRAHANERTRRVKQHCPHIHCVLKGSRIK